MKIDVVASESHYLAHMIPIWAALPKELQGTVHPLNSIPVTKPPFGRIAMVAGWQDVNPLRGRCSMIYVEHGAGQTYVDRAHDPSYSGSGGARHQTVMGYIAPSQTVADRWTAAPSVAVGCPKLDQYIGKVQPFNNVETPEVCFAWHWDCTLVPETRTAWPHYEHDFAEIVERFRLQGFRVTAHEHPKWRGAMNKIMESHGVEIRHSDTEVLTNAHVLFVDNSSLAYEFAALNKPVFLLNAPWYRREIEHGLRFWSYPPGLEIQNPEELLKYNLWDILHRSPDQLISEFRREAAVAHAYAFVDGQSSVRAAEWITNLVG